MVWEEERPPLWRYIQYTATPCDVNVCRNIAVVQFIRWLQVQGDNSSDRDLNAVQRGDAEMEQKMNRALRACLERSSGNPICSIHDQGAGGNGTKPSFFSGLVFAQQPPHLNHCLGFILLGNNTKHPPQTALQIKHTPHGTSTHRHIDSPAGPCVLPHAVNMRGVFGVCYGSKTGPDQCDSLHLSMVLMLWLMGVKLM